MAEYTFPRDDTALTDLREEAKEEFAATRRLLERYPEEHADWKPHEKSMSLVQLASHVADLPEFGRAILQDDDWDFETKPFSNATARTREEILALFEQRAREATAGLEALNGVTADAEWRLRKGDVVFFTGRRRPLVRRWMLYHMAHHRGQLTVYYRLLGIPVPGMFGPSADEM